MNYQAGSCLVVFKEHELINTRIERLLEIGQRCISDGQAVTLFPENGYFVGMPNIEMPNIEMMK